MQAITMIEKQKSDLEKEIDKFVKTPKIPDNVPKYQELNDRLYRLCQEMGKIVPQLSRESGPEWCTQQAGKLYEWLFQVGPLPPN